MPAEDDGPGVPPQRQCAACRHFAPGKAHILNPRTNQIVHLGSCLRWEGTHNRVFSDNTCSQWGAKADAAGA